MLVLKVLSQQKIGIYERYGIYSSMLNDWGFA